MDMTHQPIDRTLQWYHTTTHHHTTPPIRKEYALDSKSRETILPPGIRMYALRVPPPFEECHSLCDTVKDDAKLATAAAPKHKERVVALLSFTLSDMA